MSRQYHGYDSQGMPQDIQFSETTNALAYGAGIIINPVNYLSVTPVTKVPAPGLKESNALLTALIWGGLPFLIARLCRFALHPSRRASHRFRIRITPLALQKPGYWQLAAPSDQDAGGVVRAKLSR